VAVAGDPHVRHRRRVRVAAEIQGAQCHAAVTGNRDCRGVAEQRCAHHISHIYGI